MADEEITLFYGDKALTANRNQNYLTFDALSSMAAQSLHSGESVNIELDYSETPVAWFVLLYRLGVLSKYDTYTLDLIRKSCKCTHTANNWLKMHHIPMMRRLTNERSRRSHLGEE